MNGVELLEKELRRFQEYANWLGFEVSVENRGNGYIYAFVWPQPECSMDDAGHENLLGKGD